MSRKVALLVTAEVMTRIVVEVADDFDVENISTEEFEKIANSAQHRLVGNLYNDYMDCVTDIELDKECPHTDYKKAIREFIETNGTDAIDNGVECKFYKFEEPYKMYLNNDDCQVLSVLIEEGKLLVAFDDCGYLFESEITDGEAECIYTHLHDCNLI